MQAARSVSSDPGPSKALAGLAWLERRLSMPPIFLVLAALMFLIAWNRGIALLYALFALLAGAGLLSLIGPRLMLRTATVRIRLPVEAAVGELVKVRVVVQPQAWPPARHLVELPAPYPFAPLQSLFLGTCGAGADRAQEVLCTRRGVFHWNEVQATCSYPFGLHGALRSWSVQADRFTVYPRVYRGDGPALPAASTREQANVERPSSVPGTELFRELREYRRGDNPRHIHWRSSAHRGELVVRQFDAIAAGETWIVLDLDPENHAGADENHSFERAVELAASVAARQIGAGLRCGLAGGLRDDGSPVVWVPPRAGEGHLRTLMDELAVVQADCAQPYERVLDSLSGHAAPGQQWVLFEHGDVVPAPAFLRQGFGVYRFRFDTASFADADQTLRTLRPAERRSNGVTIARDTDLAALFQS